MIDHAVMQDVTPAEAAILQGQGALLVDVREPDEWAVGHAPGAVHVPLGELGLSVERFGQQRVLVVCRSGSRSARATASLEQVGVRARNVAGGMRAWADAGLPIVRDDGTPGGVA